MPGEEILLSSWSAIEKPFACKDLIKVGYDVIDSWGGVSPLNNMGFDDQDVERLQSSGVKSNEYGLLDCEADACTFIEIANTIAPEHAPYEVVEVYVRLPK